MTIITKAIGEKKPADKMEQPLTVDVLSEGDPEAGHPPKSGGAPFSTIKDQVFILRRANLRRNSWTIYCLVFTAILGMGIGVIGGLYIYRHYARDQMHRFRTGWYSIPYEQQQQQQQQQQRLEAASDGSPIDREGLVATESEQRRYLELFNDRRHLDGDYFKERFEIDLHEHYEEIDVPDFRGGRQGRFIHDFNNNLTGIIDIDGRCCFVMPLNRKRVLPPRNMYDLLTKMYDGYYEVNTEVVRETMRAVFPPIRDLSTVGAYIGRECEHMPTYLLEKVEHTGVAKRSISDGIYGQYAGKSIDEVEIINLDRVLALN